MLWIICILTMLDVFGKLKAIKNILLLYTMKTLLLNKRCRFPFLKKHFKRKKQINWRTTTYSKSHHWAPLMMYNLLAVWRLLKQTNILESVGWITHFEALKKRKWRSYEWLVKQWIRVYYTTGSHQYLFIMSVWEINLLANLYSPQLIPVFLPERFCSRMSVAQLFNSAIKNSESHGPLELERHCKVWYQTRNE